MLEAEQLLIKARILYGLARFEEAQQITDSIHAKDITGYSRVRALQAQILFRTGAEEEARAAARSLLKRTPEKSRMFIRTDLEALMGPLGN